jgi:hypothetical protein
MRCAAFGYSKSAGRFFLIHYNARLSEAPVRYLERDSTTALRAYHVPRVGDTGPQVYPKPRGHVHARIRGDGHHLQCQARAGNHELPPIGALITLNPRPGAQLVSWGCGLRSRAICITKKAPNDNKFQPEGECQQHTQCLLLAWRLCYLVSKASRLAAAIMRKGAYLRGLAGTVCRIWARKLTHLQAVCRRRGERIGWDDGDGFRCRRRRLFGALCQRCLVASACFTMPRSRISGHNI